MLAFLRLFCRDIQDRHQLSSCTALPLAPAAILVQYLVALVCLSLNSGKHLRLFLQSQQRIYVFSSEAHHCLAISNWNFRASHQH